MRARTPGALAVGIFLLPIIALAQAPPPRDRSTTDAPTGTARLRGRVVAADTGTPLRRAQVRAVASANRTTRLTSTDAAQPGEEWDPELRKRIGLLGKRFTLKEGETLQIEMPYVE
jgi:hypothetical protein